MFSSFSRTLSILHCCPTFLDASVYWLHTSGSILWVRYCRRRRTVFGTFSIFLLSRKWTFNRKIMKLKKGNKGEDVSQEIGPHKNCSVPLVPLITFLSSWLKSQHLRSRFCQRKRRRRTCSFFFLSFGEFIVFWGIYTTTGAQQVKRERRLWFFPSSLMCCRACHREHKSSLSIP